MNHLRLLRTLFNAAKKPAVAFVITTAIAAAGAGQTNTFPSSGNAGVGTTTPTLQSGTTNTMIEVRGTVNPGVGLTSTAAGGRQYYVYSSQANPGYFSVFDATAGADRFVISNSGNVGIGTTSPGNDLHVKKSVSAGIVSATIENTDAGIPDSSAGLNVISKNSTSASQYTRSFLNLVSGHGAVGYVDNSDFASGIVFTTSSGQISPTTQSFTLGTRPWTSSLEFHSDATNHILVLKRNGNVGIGATTPGQKLSVVGTIESTSGGFKFPDGTVQTTAFSGGGVSSAANVSAGQFGANTGGGNYIFPGVLTLNGGSSSNWGALNVGGTASINAAGNIYSYSRICAGNSSGNCDSSNGVVIAGGGSNAYGNVYLTGSGNTYFNGGNVGIGKTDPQYKLDVVGDIKASGTIHAKYQDLAEWVPSSEQLAAGTVVVLDTTKSNQVVSATVAYDTRVAGVISAQPGITLGEGGEGKVLVATTGRVRVKVDASRGAIQIGDLLVTSDVPGVAMKSEAVEFAGRKMHMPGTIIGKALEPLAKGSGDILVLLSLQ